MHDDNVIKLNTLFFASFDYWRPYPRLLENFKNKHSCHTFPFDCKSSEHFLLHYSLLCQFYVQAKTQGSNADEQKAAVEAQLLEECQRYVQMLGSMIQCSYRV